MQENRTKSKTSYWNLAIFLLVILIIVAGAYYFWISSEKKSQEITGANESIVISTNNNKNLNTNVATLKNYKNTSYNFQLDHPSDWSVDETTTGEGENQIFTVSFAKDNKSVSVSIMAESMEGIVKNSININSEETITINNLKATKLEGGDAKDGSPVSIVLITKNSKLFIIKGNGQEFEELVDSFELNN